MESQELKSRRCEFVLEPGKRDFSGEDFRSIYFGAEPHLNHSYFNGIQAIDCAFDHADMRNIEMAEAQLENCQLHYVDMSGSDLVGSKFHNVDFISCNFAEGEWRDSSFIGCAFKGCHFEHTTVNLCIFEECTFCTESSAYFEQLCINYNTFLGCLIGHRIQNDAVLSRNFALPAAHKSRLLAPTGRGITLEHACLASGYGDFNIEAIAIAIEDELADSRQRRLRKLRIEFIVNVITQLASQSMISAPSLIYIESIFTTFARSVHSDADLRIAMSAIMAIRNAIFEATQADDELVDDTTCCVGIGVTYEADLEVEDAHNLAHLLTCAIAMNGVEIITRSTRRGSLIIDYVVNGSLTISAALMAVNFALAQATKTVNHVSKLKESLVAVIAPLKHRRNSTQSPAKLPAIERNGGLATEMEIARNAVNRIGRRVTRLDRPSKIRFDLDQ